VNEIAAANASFLGNGVTALDSITAAMGNYVSVSIGEVSGTTDFTPWIRMVAPDEALVGNSWGGSSATIDPASATQTGKYRVIVGTADSGIDAAGTYRLTVNGTGVSGQ
jgi:hypothetical protein